MSTNGTGRVEFAVPTPNSDPRAIIAGPDGNLWFLEFQGNKLARITPSGTITEFPLPTPAAFPSSLTTGPDGAIWIMERTRIARFKP